MDMSEVARTKTERNRHIRRLLQGVGIGVALLGIALVVWLLVRPTALEQAKHALALGDVRTAEQIFLKHLATAPHDTSIRLKLAVLIRETDPVRALTHLRQIPETADEHLDSLRQTAIIYILSDLNDEAERVLKILEAADESDFAVQLSLAELYFREGQNAEALPHAEKAIELQPERAQSYLLLADILDNLRRTENMVRPLQEAIRLEPNLYAAHLNLAHAALFVEDTDLAEGEARWCLQREPNDVVARRLIAAVARARGLYDLALREIRSAVKLAPEDVKCRMLEAELLLFRREAQKAYESLIPLRRAQWDNRAYVTLLARAAAMSGRRDEARSYQRQIVRLTPDPSKQ